MANEEQKKIIDLSGLKEFQLKEHLENLKSRYHLGAYDTVDTSNVEYDLITRRTGYLIIDALPTAKWNPATNIFGGLVTLNDYLEPDITTSGIKVYATAWNQNETCIVYLHNSNDPAGQYRLFWNTTIVNNDLPIKIQYKLVTPYTEKVIKNRPLNTLDQQGNQWLRNEWEKNLNKAFIEDYGKSYAGNGDLTGRYGVAIESPSTFSFYRNGSASGDASYMRIQLYFSLIKPNTTYTFTVEGRRFQDCWVNINGSTIATQTGNKYTNNLVNVKITFTTPSSLSSFSIVLITGYINETIAATTCSVMLVEGSNASAYKDINELVKRDEVLLWSNNSPDQAQSPTDFYLQASVRYFKYLILEYKQWYSPTQPHYFQKISIPSSGTSSIALCCTAVASDENLAVMRSLYISGSNHFYIYDCYANSAIDNQRLILVKIFGTNNL